MGSYFEKRVSSVLDYKFDWAGYTNRNPSGTSNWLETGEKIESFSLTSSSGINISGSLLTDNDTSVTFWASGGTLFQLYDITCEITTNASPVARVDSRTIKIKVVQ
jgi:hypothetical protein